MSENMMMEDSIPSVRASLDTSANVLQGTFKHYFEVAMDHHAKAATTSNFLLIIMGLIISFVSSDKVIDGTVDLISGVAVFFIGGFGVVWTRKQFERYTFWIQVAHQYQKDLAKIVPELKTEDNYYIYAKMGTAKKYGAFAKIHDLWLWALLHCIVAVIGLGVMVIAALKVMG